MSTDLSKFKKQVRDPARSERLDQLTTHRLNILIIEDDEQSQKMLEFILKGAGHAVKFGFSGIDAVEMVKTGEFDLVLMDIQMPLMDGFEATRRIRQWEKRNKHLAIVGLTAISETEHKSCLQAGMDDVISKPFDLQELHDLFAVCVDQKKLTKKEMPVISNDPPTRPSIIDVQGAIKRFAGDRETYAMLLNEFILSLSGKFEELTRDYEASNWQRLSSHVHNLKGLSANFGATELSLKVFEMEQYIDESRYDQTLQKLNEIDASIQNLRNEALAFLTNLSTDKGKFI